MYKDPMGSDSINIRLTSKKKRKNDIYMDRRRARKMYYKLSKI